MSKVPQKVSSRNLSQMVGTVTIVEVVQTDTIFFLNTYKKILKKVFQTDKKASKQQLLSGLLFSFMGILSRTAWLHAFLDIVFVCGGFCCCSFVSFVVFVAWFCCCCCLLRY